VGRQAKSFRPRAIAWGFFAVTLVWQLASVSASQRVPMLHPVDEGPRSPHFLKFRARLQSIVTARDVAGLLGIVHPDIRNTFGGDDGKEAFVRLWELKTQKSGGSPRPTCICDGPTSMTRSTTALSLALGFGFGLLRRYADAFSRR
jgi:hypothetical protein